MILRTIEALSSKFRIGVVEGDTRAVILDAEKIMDAGVPAVQMGGAKVHECPQRKCDAKIG